jgi:hypothetical protein
MTARKMLLWAVGCGFLISLLLLCFEWLSSRSSPFGLALPGWLLVIYFWGFEGGKGPWPILAYLGANTLVYSLLILVLLMVASHFRKRES